MIGNTTKGPASDIGAMLIYVDDREKGETLFLQNMPYVQSKEQIISLMETTAGLSKRCEKPIYHLSISWDPNDMNDAQKKTMEEMGVDITNLEPEKVSNEEMTMVAKRMLKNLGLEEHQAVVARHRDKPHPHLHILVNRIHPEVGTAWRGSKDWETIERTLRSLEREFGWRETPGRNASLPGHEIPPRRDSSKAGVYSNKKKGLSAPKEGQPAPDKFILSLTEHGQTLTMPSGLPQNARQLGGCRKRAVEGDAHCQWQMGEIYRLGAGVEADQGIAMAWYHEAAERGYVDARVAYEALAEKGFTREPSSAVLGGEGIETEWKGGVSRQRSDDEYGIHDRGLDHGISR